MKECKHKSGYLRMYTSGGDEMHADLISEEHYKKIKEVWDDAPDVKNAYLNGESFEEEYKKWPEWERRLDEAAFETDALFTWFTQTGCVNPWPYTNVKILGTVQVWCC
jgi:hypothetical protein